MEAMLQNKDLVGKYNLKQLRKQNTKRGRPYEGGCLIVQQLILSAQTHAYIAHVPF